MSVFRIIHHDRRWPRVANHLDGRECPHCKATVHGGHRGQQGHEEWHEEMWALLDEFRKRTGMAEEDIDVGGGTRWTAVVEEGFDAVEGGSAHG